MGSEAAPVRCFKKGTSTNYPGIVVAVCRQPVKSKDAKITTSTCVEWDESPEKFSVYQRLRRFDRDNKGFITHHDLRMVTSELARATEERSLIRDSTSTAKRAARLRLLKPQRMLAIALHLIPPKSLRMCLPSKYAEASSQQGLL